MLVCEHVGTVEFTDEHMGTPCVWVPTNVSMIFHEAISHVFRIGVICNHLWSQKASKLSSFYKNFVNFSMAGNMADIKLVEHPAWCSEPPCKPTSDRWCKRRGGGLAALSAT